MQVSEISGFLGGENALRGDITSRMDLIELSSKGNFSQNIPQSCLIHSG